MRMKRNGVTRHSRDPGAGRDRVFLPSEKPLNDVAGRKAVVTGFLDDTEREAPHDLSDLDRRQVRGRRIHPHPVRGVERKVDVSYEKFTVFNRTDLLLHPLEVAGGGFARRAGGKAPLAIDSNAHDESYIPNHDRKARLRREDRVK